MSITKDTNGKIVYTEPTGERLFEQTGAFADKDFTLVHKDNVLKQIQFQVNPQDTNPGILTISADIGPDAVLDLTALSGAVPDTRNISTTAPLQGGGDLSADRTLSITKSDASTDGYLSSIDFNTFNGKQDSLGYTPQDSADKGQPNGYASLDSAGKVPTSQLPSAIMEFKGAWDAANNLPSLVDGTGNPGDVYRVSVEGTHDFGPGPVVFYVGDFVIYNGTNWQRSPAADGVMSVNGMTGAVVLTQGDLTESTSSVLTVTGGAGAVWGSGTSIEVKQASSSQSGYLSSSNWTTFNGKQSAGNYITDLTSDVSASGPGSVSATVNSVGGSAASAVHSAELLANAATSANTASAIVKRDGSGNFNAGTITATLSGNATNVSGVVAIANGGTGQTTASAAFDTLSPNTTLGDLTYRGNSANVRLAGNTTSTKNYLTQTGTGSVSAAPTWSSFASSDLPTIALTSDVTGSASGGSITTTVAAVGGSTASQIHAAELLANAATNSNTPSTIVKRDASGNFSAGTITASLTGNATNVSGTVAVANGGTGANTLTSNNVILGNGSSAVQFVAPSTSGNVLTSNGSTWVSSAASGGGTITAWAVDSGASIAGGGTTSSSSIWRRRVGDSYEYRGNIVLGTTSGTNAALVFSDWTIDTAKMTSNAGSQAVGYWNLMTSTTININTDSASGQAPLFYDGSTSDRVFFTRESGATANQFSKQGGSSIWASSSRVSFFITGIPVSGFGT